MTTWTTPADRADLDAAILRYMREAVDGSTWTAAALRESLDASPGFQPGFYSDLVRFMPEPTSKSVRSMVVRSSLLRLLKSGQVFQSEPRCYGVTR